MNSLLERKKLLWAALSNLCLDTEMQDFDYKYVARVIREQGFTVEEAERIAFEEVFPVLHGNLLSTAGVWTGFDPDWLAAEIERRANNPWQRFIKPFVIFYCRQVFEKDWEKVKVAANSV